MEHDEEAYPILENHQLKHVHVHICFLVLKETGMDGRAWFFLTGTIHIVVQPDASFTWQPRNEWFFQF